MCGLAAIHGSEANMTTLHAMLALMTHRGEPSHQYETTHEDQAALGMHRLAIVDEDHGQQPKVSTDHQVTLLFNGEIYNLNEVATELTGPFRASCDSEVLLHAYLHWGMALPRYLEGAFAIIILDRRQNGWLLIRDRLGIKPLYHTEQRGTHYAASELKAFTALPQASPIHAVPPGSVWCHGQVHRYYNLQSFRSSGSLCQSDVLQLREQLHAAVRRRIPKDAERVACLFSGGLDSAVITHLARAHHPRVVAYTLSRGEPDRTIQSWCQAQGIEQVIVSPDVSTLQQLYLTHGVWMTESFEPTLIRNAVSYHLLCRQVAADGFKLVLNGEGADELLGGYDFIQQAPDSHRDALTWYSLNQLHRTYLQMADRASMHTTLEARVPYLDTAVVETCLQLPPDARIQSPHNKIALRRAFAQTLPIFHDKKKVGMNEGAGYGVNDSRDAIYHQAVTHHYQQHPKQLQQDLESLQTSPSPQDHHDLEYVYAWARWVDYGFHHLTDTHQRLQLNGLLRPDWLQLIQQETTS